MSVISVRVSGTLRRLQAVPMHEIRSGTPCFDVDQRPAVAVVDIGHAVLVKRADSPAGAGRFVWRDRARITPIPFTPAKQD